MIAPFPIILDQQHEIAFNRDNPSVASESERTGIPVEDTAFFAYFRQLNFSAIDYDVSRFRQRHVHSQSERRGFDRRSSLETGMIGNTVRNCNCRNLRPEPVPYAGSFERVGTKARKSRIHLEIAVVKDFCMPIRCVPVPAKYARSDSQVSAIVDCGTGRQRFAGNGRQQSEIGCEPPV
ncbi:hypothetical protein [Victivallis vadensis]|uniref:hypothetical protein n=1 Tax=Victivallis vadensis TaxID=172901 RepID=UPI0023F4848B|nr:hypothetical protein [Victivallis vadensis]